MPTETAWDYIIVGAGSSGCVMADRLSRDPAARVLVLEAGGENRSFMIDMPKGIGKLAHNPVHAWHYPVAEPRIPDEPATEMWVRGRGLGGSSAINGMIWVRGQPEDYDGWTACGAAGWDWATMKRAFMAIEDHELGEGDGRGVGGPVHVSAGTYRYPLAEAAIAAGEALGLERKADLNGERQEGIGYFSHNIRAGRRQSAALAFLAPARRRRNVTVVTGAEVNRILFDGTRATAVEAVRDGRTIRYPLAGEVIVSAGAIVSPAILQRSGVGPGAVLAAAGVPVVSDRPAIGRHLRDHLGLSLAFRLRGDPGNNREFRKLGLVRNAVRYGLFRTGPLATGPYEVGAFVRSSPGVARPDLQIYVGAFTFARNQDPNFPVQLSTVEKEPGLTIYGQMLRLQSEGSVAIGGAGLVDRLDIRPNWLASEDDQRVAIDTVRYIRAFARQAPLADALNGELTPGAALASDAQILEAARRLSRAGTHATGSCGMGGDGAALDPDCRVRGVEGVRVVDCSAMPTLVSGNTNAPAMAFAWAAADRMGARR